MGLLDRLAERLMTEFGKGFDASNLYKMCHFYRLFPKLDALRPELSWTHFRLLLRVDDTAAREWYMVEAATQNWSTRALERQIGTLYYERLLASRDRKPVRAEAARKVAAAGASPREFVRDPDNPFDPNAVAVFSRDGRQLGHLPRYDAAYFSPLIEEGAIALKGTCNEGDRADRLPLALEAYATSSVSAVLVRDDRDDFRVIYHNLFIDVWERLPAHSAGTLLAFRDRFRPIAHEGRSIRRRSSCTGCSTGVLSRSRAAESPDGYHSIQDRSNGASGALAGRRTATLHRSTVSLR